MKPETHGRARAADEAGDATRGSAIKLAAEVLSRLVTLATTVLIARSLGVAGFGAFGRYWALAPLFAELAELGLQATASRALVANTFSLRALVRARIVVFSLVAAVALAATVPPLGPVLDGWTPDWLGVEVLVAFVFFFALSGWGEFLGVALRCRGAKVQEGLLLLILRSSGLALAAVALVAGVGLMGLALALTVSTLPAIALGGWLLRRHDPSLPGPDASIGSVLRAVVPLAVYGGLLLLGPRVELVVLFQLRGEHEIGLYFTALNLLWPLSLVPSAVAAGAMPALTREALSGKGVVRRRTASTLALFAAPAAVGLALVAPSLVPFVFGADYAPAAIWLRILSLALIPMFMNGLVAWALIAAGRASWLPRLLATRIGVAFALALILVPRHGATGAAAGFVVAEILLLALGARACARSRFPIPLVKPVALALLATGPMALAVSGVRDQLPLALALGVLTYAATLAASWRLLPGTAARLLGGTKEVVATGSASQGEDP